MAKRKKKEQHTLQPHNCPPMKEGSLLTSGYVYICDPSTLASPADRSSGLPSEKNGDKAPQIEEVIDNGEGMPATVKYSKDTRQHPFLKSNPFADWSHFVSRAPTEPSNLPAIEFQEKGIGKGILVPVNALNGRLNVKVKKDKVTGKVTKITIDVVE